MMRSIYSGLQIKLIILGILMILPYSLIRSEIIGIGISVIISFFLAGISSLSPLKSVRRAGKCFKKNRIRNNAGVGDLKEIIRFEPRVGAFLAMINSLIFWPLLLPKDFFLSPDVWPINSIIEYATLVSVYLILLSGGFLIAGSHGWYARFLRLVRMKNRFHVRLMPAFGAIWHRWAAGFMILFFTIVEGLAFFSSFPVSIENFSIWSGSRFSVAIIIAIPWYRALRFQFRLIRHYARRMRASWVYPGIFIESQLVWNSLDQLRRQGKRTSSYLQKKIEELNQKIKEEREIAQNSDELLKKERRFQDLLISWESGEFKNRVLKTESLISENSSLGAQFEVGYLEIAEAAQAWMLVLPNDPFIRKIANTNLQQRAMRRKLTPADFDDLFARMENFYDKPLKFSYIHLSIFFDGHVEQHSHNWDGTFFYDPTNGELVGIDSKETLFRWPEGFRMVLISPRIIQDGDTESNFLQRISGAQLVKIFNDHAYQSLVAWKQGIQFFLDELENVDAFGIFLLERTSGALGASDLVLDSERLLSEGDVQGARERALLAMKAMPGQRKAMRVHAITSIRMEDWLSAHETLKSWLEYDPYQIDALRWIARVSLKLKKFQESIRYSELGNRVAPAKVEFLQILSVAYARSGNLEDAKKALTKALALEPDNLAIKADYEKILARLSAPSS